MHKIRVLTKPPIMCAYCGYYLIYEDRDPSRFPAFVAKCVTPGCLQEGRRCAAPVMELTAIDPYAP